MAGKLLPLMARCATTRLVMLAREFRDGGAALVLAVRVSVITGLTFSNILPHQPYLVILWTSNYRAGAPLKLGAMRHLSGWPGLVPLAPLQRQIRR